LLLINQYLRFSSFWFWFPWSSNCFVLLKLRLQDSRLWFQQTLRNRLWSLQNLDLWSFRIRVYHGLRLGVLWLWNDLSLRVGSFKFWLNNSFKLSTEGEKKHKKGGLNCVFKNFSFLRNKNCSQDQSLIEFRVWLEFRVLMQRIDSKRAEKERTQAIIQVPSTNRK